MPERGNVKHIIKIINMFFGKKPEKRFERAIRLIKVLCMVIIIIVFIVSLSIAVIQNISYDKTNGFQWRPAIDKINIEVKK